MIDIANSITAYETERGTFELKDAGRTIPLKDKAGNVTTYGSSNIIQKMALKTGTTICGVITTEGVVLAADTRSTAGSTVADKNCFKLHKLCPSIWCAGAGTAADLDHVTNRLAADLKLFASQVKSAPRVETCVNRLCQQLFRYQGHISVALIVGGINPDGKGSLWYVSPHGYSHSLPYMAMGSGGYFAQAIMEDQYRDGLTLDQGKELAANAIQSGIMNDLGSGSNVDVVSISIKDPSNPVLCRGYRTPVVHMKKQAADVSTMLAKTVVIAETIRQIQPFNSENLSCYLSC